MDPTTILIVGAIIALAWFIYASRSLSAPEVESLATRMRFTGLEKRFDFVTHPLPVDLDFKKRMASGGALY